MQAQSCLTIDNMIYVMNPNAFGPLWVQHPGEVIIFDTIESQLKRLTLKQTKMPRPAVAGCAVTNGTHMRIF